PEKGIAGYHVYKLGAKPFEIVRVTETPVRATAFTHRAGRTTTRYWVVAVDALGQEGQPSSPVWFHHSYKGFYPGDWHQEERERVVSPFGECRLSLRERAAFRGAKGDQRRHYRRAVGRIANPSGDSRSGIDSRLDLTERVLCARPEGEDAHPQCRADLD